MPVLFRAQSALIKPHLGGLIDHGHPLAKGLVGCWLCNEGRGAGTVYDLSPYQNRGAVTDVVFANSARGWAGTYNGTSAECRIPNSPSLNPDYITVAAWIKTDDSGSIREINSKDWNVSNRVWQFRMETSGVLGFVVFNAASFGFATSTGTINDGAWHHVAGTYDGAMIRCYIDGVADGTDDLTGAMRSGQNNDVFLGRYEGAGTYYWAGEIGESQVWNRALGAGEISQLRWQPYCYIRTPMPRRWAWAASAAATMPIISSDGIHSAVFGGQVVTG